MLEKLVSASLPLVPQPIMRRLAMRYIAGETLESALEVLAGLAGRGFPGILDVLGEGVRDRGEARAAADHYLEAAEAVARRGLDAYLSVKPTHFGLNLDTELCHALYAELARRAADLSLFVRVEMEDATTTDATFAVFEKLRAEFDNVGIVLQARLFRTLADIDVLARTPLDVRMVKGVYLEPAKIAHTEPEAIRDAFLACTRKLFEKGAHVRLATHDGPMAERLIALVEELGVEKERYEFQVLMGVQEQLWNRWRDAGHRVRVYVPYGPEWRAYSTRRLQKNPEIIRHVMRNALSFRG